MATIISIDIGGTNLRAAKYPQETTRPVTIAEKVPSLGMEGGVFDRLCRLIDKVWPQEQAAAISIAVAGPLDPQTGVIIKAPNIPEWKNYPLAELLEKRYHVPVFLGNDANLAALGEWRYGAGKGHHNLVYLTVSTGIGGGVIIDDRLLEGQRGMAAELGHVTILPDGPLCSCGARGHLEAVASGSAIANYVKEQMDAGRPTAMPPGVGAKEIAAAAEAGEALAIEAFTRAGEFIGQATADFLHIFNPSIVVFGGGVSESWSLIEKPIRDSLERNIMDRAYLDGLEICRAKLGDDVGLVGALVQAQMQLAERG